MYTKAAALHNLPATRQNASDAAAGVRRSCGGVPMSWGPFNPKHVYPPPTDFRKALQATASGNPGYVANHMCFTYDVLCAVVLTLKPFRLPSSYAAQIDHHCPCKIKGWLPATA